MSTNMYQEGILQKIHHKTTEALSTILNSHIGLTGRRNLQQAGRYVVWKTEKPNSLGPLKSDIFLFKDIERYFELCLNVSYFGVEYEIYMRNTSGQKIPQSFEVTTYIEHDEEKMCLIRETIMGEKIRTFYFGELEQIIPAYQSIETLHFVFVFHGDEGLTLQLCDHYKKEPQKDICQAESLGCLSQDMSKMLSDGSNHDVELKCGERTFKAHRNILSARSEVFQAMLQSSMVEGTTGVVEIPDMEADAFQGFLQYVYSGKMPDLSIDNARSFYEAGDKYMMQGLVRFCANFMFTNLSKESACNILILADAHSDQYLKEGIIAYILDNKIPLQDDHWLPFCKNNLKLANEVLNRAYKSQIKK